MKLAEWFKTPEGSKVSKASFADSIGVTPQMISAYCKEQERTVPNEKRIEAIYRETAGAVAPNDWYDLQEGAAQ